MDGIHWPAVVGIVAVVSLIGGAAIAWIRGEITKGDTRCTDALLVLKDKIDTETETLESKIDHKHRNVDTQFDSIRLQLERTGDKMETLAKDHVRASERLASQESQAREFKAEVKESIHSLGVTMDVRLKEMSQTQQTHFEHLTQAIRDLRNSGTSA